MAPVLISRAAEGRAAKGRSVREQSPSFMIVECTACANRANWLSQGCVSRPVLQYSAVQCCLRLPAAMSGTVALGGGKATR